MDYEGYLLAYVIIGAISTLIFALWTSGKNSNVDISVFAVLVAMFIFYPILVPMLIIRILRVVNQNSIFSSMEVRILKRDLFGRHSSRY